MQKLVATLLLASLTLSTSAAFACSCAPPPSIEEHLDSVDVIFKGVALKTRKKWFSGRYAPAHTSFEITHAYKGTQGDTVRVAHSLDGGLCGVHFTKGEEVLVLAHREDGAISTSLCTMIAAQVDPEGYRAALE